MVELLISILDPAKAGALKALRNASGAKVHASEILKIMSDDAENGEATAMALARFPEWEQCRHQKHDLFMTQTAKTDYFLQDASNAVLALEDAGGKAIGAIRDGSVGGAAAAAASGERDTGLFAGRTRGDGDW